MADIEKRREFIETRRQYVELVRKELLGPGSEVSIPDEQHELITNPPDVRYSIGILFPRENKLNADNDDSARIEESASDYDVDDSDEEQLDQSDVGRAKPNAVNSGDEDNLDEEIGLAAQNMPSSMGITFFARGDSSTINCHVSFATYRHANAKDCRIPFYPNNPEEYSIPDQFAPFFTFDSEEKCLKFTDGGVSRKTVRDLEERDVLDSDEYGIFNAMYKLSDQLRSGYVRIPHFANVKLEFDNSDYIDNNRALDETTAKVTALRRKIDDGLYSITIMLVNDREDKSNGTKCLFQPEIRILTEDNLFSFSEYSGVSDFSLLDDEEKSLELQYRNKRVYGTGLGTSLNWNVDDNGNGELHNDFFPQVEVPQMDFELPDEFSINPKTFSMKYLSDLSSAAKDEKIALLRTFILAYKAWIDGTNGLVSKLKAIDDKYEGRYHEIGQKNIAGCLRSYHRMEKGIESLAADQNKWASFELANRAMFMQRVHLNLQAKTSNRDRYPYDEELTELLDGMDYSDDDGFTEDKYSWRPFQLAFLLMSVDSVSNDSCEDRDVVDLIWFPTGGGKTEAYLGLTAFTIFYRRLAYNDNYAGTTVIMRYTLRLLAAQQFTRASTLICACEYIRRDSLERKPKYKAYPLGDEEITIGLWIGGDHTPNKNDKAREHLQILTNSTADNLRENKDKHNKFQVLKCPWCGTKLVKDKIDGVLVGAFGYRMKNNRHFELYCPQESCFYNQVGKLPIQIVDDELYMAPPTLLFGTVDKFAMLPWKKEIGSFFGLNTKNRTPELIIQDELHLISGPLGTMVGLYETAIDALCSSKGTKAKIVASTATIRRASEQCSALYDRAVAQFPHPGLDSEDSFFAREADIDHEEGKYGRLYVGLMPSGKTKAMMEVRSIAALLQKIKSMVLSDEIKDKYWTLTAYFNSLKDLGKCSTLIDDDVKDFIKRSVYRLGTSKDARVIGSADELTSRVSTTELNETLDKLEKLVYSKENIANKRYASNVLLATNMISVGIDVARLNTMILVGQPKLTSEYIQASSRVGRSFPGVAFAMYDGSKSRDRSHYEQFKAYHESFYKYVEPTGATPFSKPARDRALHAIVISLLRHLCPILSPETGASKFTREKYADEIAMIRKYITDRDVSVIKRMYPGMLDDSMMIANEIDRITEEWERIAENYDEDHFVYGEKYMVKHPEEGEGRLLKVFNTDRNDTAFDTMTSMRNVDASVAGNVLIWGE